MRTRAAKRVENDQRRKARRKVKRRKLKHPQERMKGRLRALKKARKKKLSKKRMKKFILNWYRVSLKSTQCKRCARRHSAKYFPIQKLYS